MSSNFQNGGRSEYDTPCGESADGTAAPPSTGPTPRYRYSDLSRAGTEVLIEHEGQMYRLRMTRNGKLILNK